jgi:hypothetical protein
MLPWHRKSIFVIVGTLRLSIFFLSIADGGRFVEGHFLMGGSFDLPQQFCLGPAVLGCGPKIPGSFLQRGSASRMTTFWVQPMFIANFSSSGALAYVR